MSIVRGNKSLRMGIGVRSLKEIGFSAVYFKTRNEIFEEFYRPCMESSISYDRISGYFGSSVFFVINQALRTFLTNHGHIRLICSPVLSDEDLQAIKEGYAKKEPFCFSDSLCKVIDNMFSEFPQHTLLLSELIKKGYMEIKLAVFFDNIQGSRLFHDKAGIFRDSFENAVAFRGSFNETFKGISKCGNSESFDVDTSWGENKEKTRVSFVSDQFEKIWRGIEPGILTLNVPDVSIEKIKSYQSDISLFELLDEISSSDVNCQPSFVRLVLPYYDFVIGEKIPINFETNKEKNSFSLVVKDPDVACVKGFSLNALSPGNTILRISHQQDGGLFDEKEIKIIKWAAEPGINRRKVREYQEEILNNWLSVGKGIFEMVTGSGKTFTALCALRYSLYLSNSVPIIIVPRKVLFYQWISEIKKVFGNEISLFTYGAGNTNLSSVSIATSPSDKKKIIVSTIQTARKTDFIKKINQGNQLFLLIDEVHNVGAKMNQSIIDINAGLRIGLSATPRRYRDPEGTKKIMEYFGSIIEPRYPLSRALLDGALCEYMYFPKMVTLDFSETIEYQEISSRLAQRYSILKKQNMLDWEIFQDQVIVKWLIDRSKIIKKAKSKIDLTIEIIGRFYSEGQRWLIYCDDIIQLKTIKTKLNDVLSNKFHNDLFEYHSKGENSQEILQIFERNGGVLLSINCLDEGVDIPTIDHALILSSSQNFRQFIQRRGRVLRTHKSKKMAYIYDAVVSPEGVDSGEDGFPFLKYELKRALIFAKNAFNKDQASISIKSVALKNGIDITTLNNEEEGIEDEPEDD